MLILMDKGILMRIKLFLIFMSEPEGWLHQREKIFY